MLDLKAAIKKAVAGENFRSEQIQEVFGLIMEGEATPAQIGGLLIALRMKGETVDEIAGGAPSMRRHAVFVDPGGIAYLQAAQFLRKEVEVALVGFPGKRRQPTFMVQVIQKLFLLPHASRSIHRIQAERRCASGSSSDRVVEITFASKSRNRVPMPG